MSCSPSREAVAQWLVALVPGVWVRLVLPAQATAPSVKLRSGSSAQSGASRAVAPTRDGTNDTGGVAGAPAGHATMHATRHETLARRSSPHTCSEFNLCVPYEDAATGSVCTLDASHRSKRLPTASVKKSRANDLIANDGVRGVERVGRMARNLLDATRGIDPREQDLF